MTKQARFGWMNIGVALLLIAGAVYAFLGGVVGTDQLLFQGILVVCSVGLLAQGIYRVVSARRD